MDNILEYYLMPHTPEIVVGVTDSCMQRLKKTSDACKEIGEKIGKIEPDTIVILSSHGSLRENSVTVSIGDYIYGNFNEFKNIDINFTVQLDKRFSEKLIKNLKEHNMNYYIQSSENSYFKLDHGTVIPLYFINKFFTNYKLVAINSSIQDKGILYELGRFIRRICEEDNIKVIIIISSHMSEGRDSFEISKNLNRRNRYKKIDMNLNNVELYKCFDLDSKIYEKIQKNNYDFKYFIMGAADGRRIKGKLLSYERPYNIGYAVVEFEAVK